ncbi:MAG: HlyU family transcriptional regulator [Gammaproteobacteria bacterium]|nr:HlyU family transcriptional regulator [Gammaproteobacteria bacterium]
MALGKLFKSLLGGAAASAQPQPTEAVDYMGFAIEAAPIYEDGKYRSAGFISGELDGETRRIQFIRADQNGDLQAAIDHSLVKARQIIDEQGKQLLRKTHL